MASGNRKRQQGDPGYSQYRGRDREFTEKQVRNRRRIVTIDSLNAQREILFHNRRNQQIRAPKARGEDVLDMSAKTIQDDRDRNYKDSVRIICNHLTRHSLSPMAQALIIHYLIKPRADTGKDLEEELYKLIRQIFIDPVDFVLHFGQTNMKNNVGVVENVHCISTAQFFGERSFQFSVAEIFSPEIQNIIKIMCKYDPGTDDVFKYTKAYNCGSSTYVKKDFTYNKTFSELFPREELALSIFTQLVKITDIYFRDKLCGMECVRNVVDRISKDAVAHMQQGMMRNKEFFKPSKEYEAINRFVTSAYKFFAYEFNNIEYLKSHTFSFVTPCYAPDNPCVHGTNIIPESIQSITPPPQKLY